MYTNPDDWINILEEQGLTEQKILRRYDVVIYFETAARYSPEKYIVNHARSMATPTYMDAIKQDTKTKAVWISHPNFYIVSATEDFEEKIKNLYKIFQTLHNISKSLPRSVSEETFIVQMKKERPTAIYPAFKSKGAAGMDLYSDIDVKIAPMTRQLVPTGICIAIPSGHYGRIAPRSGLAVKYLLDIGAGVIDSDYRGEILVLLLNNSSKTFQVNKGDRIAQIIFEKISSPQIAVVKELDKTVRGENGFGSTGDN